VLALLLAVLSLAPPIQGQEPVPAETPPGEQKKKEEEPDLFHDPKTGDFDVSKFLDSKIGFFPLVMPITEPALGFGLAGGLVFFHTRPQVVDTPNGPRILPPITTFVGGMGTENGSWGTFAGHMHNWDDGKIRYLVAGGYASLNLDWFGQGTTSGGESFPYTLDAYFLVQKLTFKLGNSDFFLGPTQRILSTNTTFESGTLPPGIESDWLSTTVSGLGFNLGYDTRNSLFGPTRGTKTSLDVTQNDKAIGSDFDYTRAGLESCNYLPLGGPFTLGLRGDLQYASEDAPYFDLPGISLRGIRYGRYVDNVSMTLESELRWDTTPRWTLVGFGGVGWVADKFDELDESKGRGAGGFGVRYLIAKEYDLRVGIDVAAGPEDEAIYVTLGTGWVRD
jgi:hypothetical protein